MAVVIGVTVVLYLSPLFLDAPLTDPDEGLHAAISQEMLERGDLIVPRFLGTPFLDKPILFFWAQAASITAFGATTAAARLPGIIFALLGIATTGWLARELTSSDSVVEQTLSGPPIGVVAAACYATMVLPFVLAQAPVHDVAVVPFTNVALGWLWRARNGRSGSEFRNAIVAGVALGLSILAKGFEGVAIVGVGYALYLVAARALTSRVLVQGIVALSIAVVVALPWYLAMNAREPGYLRYYFVDRHVLGFATNTQRHGGQPWWFYVPVVVAGALPWIAFVRPRPLRPADVLLWTWVGGAVVLLTLSGSKAITYVFPAMPAIAILAAASPITQRLYRPVAIATACVYAAAVLLAGPFVAEAHSARDLADYFNGAGRVQKAVLVMDRRVSFVYYLAPELRRSLGPAQVRSVELGELTSLRHFPADTALALPADLADERLRNIPALAHATRIAAGRYVVLTR